MTSNPLRSAVGALLTKKLDEFLESLRELCLDELGVEPGAERPQLEPLKLRPRLAEYHETGTKSMPRRALPPAVETTKPTKVSTRSPKRQAVGESVKRTHVALGGKPGLLEESNAKRGQDLAGFRIGSFVGVRPTGEKYYGQIVWRFRCEGCGTTKDIPSQGARRAKRSPKCKCASEPTKAGAPPKAERPTPAPAPAAKPEPVRVAGKQSLDLTGATCGTFRAVGPTATRHLGGVVWVFRCTECKQERLWTKSQLVMNRRRAVRCTCKGGGVPTRTGRLPVRLTEPREEKPVDELDGDDLEREYLTELEHDREIPRLRRDEPDRRFDADPDAFDRPSGDDDDDQEDEPDELDFDAASGGE